MAFQGKYGTASGLSEEHLHLETARGFSCFPRELLSFERLTLVLTGLAWGLFLFGPMIGITTKYRWPIYPRGSSMIDLQMYFGRFQDLHRVAFFTDPGLPFVYFAPGVFLYPGLYAFGLKGCTFAYLLVATIGLFVGATLLGRQMIRAHMPATKVWTFLAIAVLASYPLLFTLERGNLEMIIAIGLALGTWAYWRQYTWAAAITWGVFGSIKMYPLLLLAMFLSERKYRQFALGVAAALVANIASTFYIGPTFAIAARGLHQGTETFVKLVALGFYAAPFDHSFFMLWKYVTKPHHLNLGELLSTYLVVMIVTFLTLYFVRVRKLPAANQLIFLSIAMVTLPPTSFDYTLIQLYAPWAILVMLATRASESGQRVRGLNASLLLMAVLFTPTTFVLVKGFSYGGQIKSCALAALLVVVIVWPLTIDLYKAVGSESVTSGGDSADSQLWLAS